MSKLTFKEQYAQNAQAAAGGNKVSSEERLKKFFTTLLPKGVKTAEKRIRILPMKDGTTPFDEALFHDIKIEGKSVKLFDPEQGENPKRSPLNEVRKSLESTGVESDRELAKAYRSRKYYIVKLIDRDNEQDGPKFWRFKDSYKQEGILDKIYPIYKHRGDSEDPINGYDLILTLTLQKAPNGKEYTTVSSVISDEKSPLHTDPKIAQEWIDDPLTWKDCYSIKSEEYLEIVATGGTPKWDTVNNKYISSTDVVENPTEVAEPVVIPDPQVDDDESDDLPF